jgi:hypothetical protein
LDGFSLFFLPSPKKSKPVMKNKEKRSNSIRKQTWFSWRTNGIQSFIGWLLFLSFSIGWTVFIPGPKKRKLCSSFHHQKKLNTCFLFFGPVMKKKEKRSNSIRKQTCFSWKTNGIQSFIGWFPFLSFSIGWTVFIPGPKKRKHFILRSERSPVVFVSNP